jgi:hypothetical protein
VEAPVLIVLLLVTAIAFIGTGLNVRGDHPASAGRPGGRSVPVVVLALAARLLGCPVLYHLAFVPACADGGWSRCEPRAAARTPVCGHG